MSAVVVSRVTSGDPSLPALISESLGRVTGIPFDITEEFREGPSGEHENMRVYRFPVHYGKFPKYLDSIVSVMERELTFLNRIYAPHSEQDPLFLLRRDEETFAILLREDLICPETCQRLNLFQDGRRITPDEAKHLARRGLSKVLRDLVNNTVELSFTFYQELGGPVADGPSPAGREVAEYVASHFGTPVTHPIIVPDEMTFDTKSLVYGRFVGSCPFLFIGFPKNLSDETGAVHPITCEGRMTVKKMIERHVGELTAKEHEWRSSPDGASTILVIKKSEFFAPTDCYGEFLSMATHQHDGAFIVGRILEHLLSVHKKTGFLFENQPPRWL